MSTQEVASGDNSNASSHGVDAEVSAPSTEPARGSEEDKVAYSSYQKALTQKKNLQARSQELEAKLQQYEQKDLEHKQKYEALWKQAEDKASAREQELLALKTKVETQAKQSALRSELAKLGLNPKHEAKALQLVDTSEVILDDEHGVLGVEEVARKFREDFDVLFQQRVPGVAQNAPRPVGSVGKPNSAMSKEEIIAQLKALEGQ